MPINRAHARWQHAVLLLLPPALQAARIPLDTRPSGAFLQSTPKSGAPSSVLAPFTWSHMYLGKLLHQSTVVELGPRGALFLTGALEPSTGPTTRCLPSDRALCVTPDGAVLPSAVLPDGTPPPPLTIAPEPDRILDPVLRLLAQVVDACRMSDSGGGRVYSAGGMNNYTVSACDVTQGTHVLVYEPRARRLSLRPQTFGPTAYLIALVSATMHIAALASSSPLPAQASTYNCALSVVACVALYFKGAVHFYLREDEALFWLAAACAILALAANLQVAYLFAVTLIATAVYRTHQTPYAPILAYVFGYQAWAQVLAAHLAPPTYSGLAHTLLLVLFTTLFCEIAIRPLYAHTGLWELQYVFHTFIVYSLAKYKELSSWLPDARAASS